MALQRGGDPFAQRLGLGKGQLQAALRIDNRQPRGSRSWPRSK
jgi:hypothetical protein